MALKNLFGEIALQETLSQLATLVSRIANALGLLSFDSAQRLRTITDISSGTITTVGAVTTSGGYQMSYDQYGQMMQGPMGLRNRITVT